MKKEDKNVCLEIVKLFKPYKWKISIIIALILISSIVTTIIPIINQHLMDNGLIAKDIKVIVRYSIYELILVFIIQFLGILETKKRSYMQNLLAFNLEKNAFEHTLKLKIKFFTDTNNAEMISNLKTDIGNISQIANEHTFYIVTSIFRIIVGVIGLLIINWKLSFLVIILTPIRYVLVKYLAKSRKNLIFNYINTYKNYSKWYGDTIAGIKEVKIWALELLKLNEFEKRQNKIIKQNVKLSYLEKANEISECIFTQIITSFIYIIGGCMLLGDGVTVGKLFAFITYSNYVTGPIFSIMNIGYSFAGIIPSAKRYFEFMNIEEEDYPKSITISNPNLDKVQGCIEFKDVCFSYNPQKKVLNNISFKINPGEKVAIIGSNGAGKTTIINLILRFLKPTSGKILLDGNDINLLPLTDYRKLISVVSQEVYLFNTTIQDNIILNSEKGIEEMNTATKKSGAYDFIDKLPDKYKSVVGESGGKLSGGERQKVAMARAFVRNFKLLILDEATANYDVEAETMVNNIINQDFKDRTIIVITHKIDILSKVDKIIVINNGQVDDIGSNYELSQRNRFYKEMIKEYE